MQSRALNGDVSRSLGRRHGSRAPIEVAPAIGLGSVILGGLYSFGSTAEVSALKVAYAALLLFVSILVVLQHLRAPAALLLRPSAVAVGISALLLGASFVISTLLGPLDHVTDAVRQGISYFLIPIAPFIGIQLGWRLSTKFVHLLTLAVGASSATSLGLDWIARRGIASIDTGRFVLGSPALSALAFSLAIVLSMHGRGAIRILGVGVVLIIPVALLITGTRTNLVIGLIVFALLGSRADFRLSFSGFAQVVVFAALSIVGLALLAPLLLSDPSFLLTRFESLFSFLPGGAIQDQSYFMRMEQYGYASSVVEGSPLFGMGFGWVPVMFLDTPLATPARVGLIGSALLVIFLILSLRLVKSAGIDFRPSPSTASARGFALFIVALLPFGAPVEDRGFALALILLFAGVSSGCRELPAPAFVETSVGLEFRSRGAVRRSP